AGGDHDVDEPPDDRQRAAAGRADRSLVPARRHGAPVLTKLLREHLRPYRRTIMLIIVLQCVQVAATLTLPGLNADIIDKGVLVNDTSYIYSRAALLLFVALIRGPFQIAAVYFGARVAMGFGRDVRAS